MTTSTESTFVIPENFDPAALRRAEFSNLAPTSIFAGVDSFLDLVYAGPVGFRPLTLDLHLPQQPLATPVPTVIYAHGGGFFLGSKQMGPWRFLLDAGFAVASISYRFSGEIHYPTPIHDVAAAIRWIRVNADRYRLDANTIIGFGSSAGAYLISAVALAGDDTSLVGRVGPHPDVSSRVAGVIEHYGPSDLLLMDEDAPPDVVEWMNRPGSSIARFLGHAPSSHPDPDAVICLNRLAGPDSPPFMIVHGDDDHRVGIEQSSRLHRALTGAGARADLVVISGGDHGSAHFDESDLHERTLTFLQSLL
nr:alpha/beta hydrolase [Rhodococcus sp. (in: high G+C Gram-positive bacteria)]